MPDLRPDARPGYRWPRIDYWWRLDRRIRYRLRALLHVEGHRIALHESRAELVLDPCQQRVLTAVHVRELTPRYSRLQLRGGLAVEQQLDPVARLQRRLRSYRDVQLALDVPKCFVLSWCLDSQGFVALEPVSFPALDCSGPGEALATAGDELGGATSRTTRSAP